jgi:hypothetical protein
MTLMHVEQGQAIYRAMNGLAPKYHVRLKHQGRTLSILQGDSEQEAHDRAERIAGVLFPDGDGVIIEPA